jgi:hypothetical protein
VFHGRTKVISFETAKSTLLESILRQNGMTFGSLLQFIEWPLEGANYEGWTSAHAHLLRFHPQVITFEAIEGFKLNLASGQT